MSSALVAALLIASGPIVEPTGTLAWAVATQTTPRTEAALFGGLEAAIARRTSLDARRARDVGVDEARLRDCGGSFVCWLDVLADGAEPPTLLLVASTIDLGEGRHRLSLALLDPELGRRARAAAEARSPGDREAAEALVFEDALVTRSGEHDLSTPEKAARVMSDLVESLKSDLVKARVWRPTSTLQVQLPPVDLESTQLTLGESELSVDGRSLVVPRVLPGAHTLTLRANDNRFAPLELNLEVPTSTVVQVVLQEPESVVLERTVRLTTRWLGVATFATGAVFLVHAVVKSQDAPTTLGLCPPNCSEHRFQRLGPALEAPLGYGLMITGATWTTGSLLEGGDYDAPWWTIIAGTLLGATAYGLSAALE